MNIEKLTDQIEEACNKAFTESINKHGADRLCGYALYSDSGAMGISPSVNTLDNLEEMQEDDPDDATYYKWSPSEWSHEAEGVEFFGHISKALLQASKNIDSDQGLIEFRDSVYSACVDALERLRTKDFFTKNSIVVFTISDTEMPDQEIKWINRLNNQQNAKEFEEWIQNVDA